MIKSIKYFLLLALLPSPAMAMKIAVGNYTGDGNATQAITIDTGWGSPDLVIITPDNATDASWRSSSLGGDATFLMEGSTAPVADYIETLDANGFTVGDNDAVNASSVEYNYLAIQDTGEDDFHVGTYSGNGSTQTIQPSGVLDGDTPDFVMIHAAGAQRTYYHIALGYAATYLKEWNTQAVHTNKFSQVETDGFSLQSHDTVNENGVTFYYIMMKEVAGYFNIDSYTGNNGGSPPDTQDVTTTGFSGITPSAVFVHREDVDRDPYMATEDMTVGDAGGLFNNPIYVSDRIDALISGGFTAGNNNNSNQEGETFSAWFFKEGQTGAASGANMIPIIFNLLND